LSEFNRKKLHYSLISPEISEECMLPSTSEAASVAFAHKALGENSFAERPPNAELKYYKFGPTFMFKEKSAKTVD
jgi:hypothetical protein